ncbi:Arm DNA-binding domain-containing protein, partial [Nitrosomonas marina]
KVQNSLTALNKMGIKSSRPLDSPYTRFDYSSKTLAFGSYPDVSLKEARKKRDEAKNHLANNSDPSLIKVVKKKLLVMQLRTLSKP